VKTFIVRIAPLETCAADGQLRGVLDEISSGRRTSFRSTGELIRLLSATNSVEPELADPAGGPEPER
jgi:hypothetical protein